MDQKTNVKNGLIAIGAIIAVFAAIFGFSEIASGTKEDDGSVKAVSSCKQAIRAHSLNRDRVDFPFDQSIKANGDRILVLWSGDASVKMQNQYGAMIDAEVLCAYLRSKDSVESLVIGDDKVM